jgi:TRAP-type mannitol/chloroaromatic compound transport system substrate-binding protein
VAQVRRRQGAAAKLYSVDRRNVVSFLYGPMPTQPLGWFKKPITKTAGFQGPEVPHQRPGDRPLFTAMGAAVNALPGSDIVPAHGRGLLDAGRSSTTPPRSACLGFPECPRRGMLQRLHQSGRDLRDHLHKPKYDRAARER